MFRDHQDTGPDRTVTLSQKDVSAARRLLRVLLGAERDTFDEQSAPNTRRHSDVQRPALVNRARQDFQNRRRRATIFGQSMFGEPAWDMLLALYIQDMSGQRQTLGTLFRFSGYSASTAKRWLDYLDAHQLVQLDPHPLDRRTAFVGLTTEGRRLLDMYYSETAETGI